MIWLLIIICAYFLFAIVNLGDKYLLKSSIPCPKVYVFYVGVFSILSLLLIPFVNFIVPDFLILALSLFTGMVFTIGLFSLFSALNLFEASRVIPAVGGITPLFVLILTYIFSGGKEVLSFFEIIAFFLLVSGSVLISWQRGKSVSGKIMCFSAVTALIGAVYFVLTKQVYLLMPFWSGFIWIRVGCFLSAIAFIFSKEVRAELFVKRISFKQKTAFVFFLNQAVGAGATVLQNWAIFLAPFAYLAIINALQGFSYIFLLLLAAFLSLKFPRILKEEISRQIILQKIIAIFLIGGGLAVLVFF